VALPPNDELDSAPEDRFETQAIHCGQQFREETGAVIPPMFLTSTFEKGNPGGFDYTRSCHPNNQNLESILAALEGAQHATVFGSGVSAITAVVSSLEQGSLILAEENLYGCTYRMFEQVFRKFGVAVEYLDLTDTDQYATIGEKQPALVWIESPTNPLMKVLDIEAIAEHCQEAGSALVVDNTFASPYVQRPLALGATLSLESTTKYINGHSDSLGGAVMTNSDEWQFKMDFARKALGLHPAPFDTWLITRGVKTLAVRMERHQENALTLAKHLEKSEAVSTVRYPFLESHPQHAVAKRQMNGGSGIVTAQFALSLAQTEHFLGELKLFTLAESLGGIESLVCHPATMTHGSVPRETREAVGITDSLVRFSVGIEHVEDLIADVEQALKTTLDTDTYAGAP
jgi:cystathionine gamma-synthase